MRNAAVIAGSRNGLLRWQLPWPQDPRDEQPAPLPARRNPRGGHPDGATDRPEDVWEPLLAVTDAAGATRPAGPAKPA